MIRPLTLICMVLFLLAGFYDYQTTHRVDLIDQQIASTSAAAVAARGDTKVLQTEWSWLNRPDRLQPFVAQFLSLEQVTPAQYVPLDQLAGHLPAPGSVPPAPATLPATTLASAAPTVTTPAQAGSKLADATSAPVAGVSASLRTSPSEAPPSDLAAARSVPATRLAEANVAPAFHANRVVSRSPDAGVQATPSALGAAQPPLPTPVRLAAAPVPAAPKLALAYRPAAIARRQAPALSAAPNPVVMADNDAARPASAPRSLSALGMAQSSPSLPAPVAMTDAAWRSEQ